MIKRRLFLTTALGAIAARKVLATMEGHAANAAMTIQQVIDAINAAIPGAPFSDTVDTVKAGDASQPVKGIVTTMFATRDVIEKAAKLGANFIIAHEPTFYNHKDDTQWLEDDPVFKSKKALLDKYGIVVWRFHDGWHSVDPDGVRMGVLRAMGWDKYYNSGAPEIVTVPELKVSDVIERAKKNLTILNMRLIGDAAQKCQRILVMPGAAGGRAQIADIRKYAPDLAICGELSEWETAEYIRDWRAQGRVISLLVLGHSSSEEPGMEELIGWLQPKVPGVKITHVPSGDPFKYV